MTLRLPARCRALLLPVLLALPLLAAVVPLGEPVVVVYPLTASSGTDPEAGPRIADLMSTKFVSLGGLNVKTPPPGTPRAQYLEAAKALGADYYIAGFLTQIGDQVSLVTQVVSTYSGTVIASSTTFPRTYSDSVSQVDALHDSILRHSGRAFASVGQPAAPTTAPTQEAATHGGMDLGKIFGHKAKAAPAPTASHAPASATTSPVAAASPRGLVAAVGAPIVALIVNVEGDSTANLGIASGALLRALQHAGVPAGQVPISSADALAHAADLCRANAGSREFYASTLTLDSASSGSTSGVVLDVTRYDCAAAPLGHAHASAAVRGTDVTGALNRAANQAVAAILRAAPPAKT